MNKEFNDELLSAKIRLNRGEKPKFNKEVFEKAQEELIDSICNMFTDPNRWPMTDMERIDLLKILYVKASAIKSARLLK